MNSPVLTEKDLEIIFSGKKESKSKGPLLRGALFLVSFLVISSLVFVVMNFSTLRQNLGFWYNNEYKAAQPSSDIQQLATVNLSQNNSSLPQINNNSLSLPIINVKAPITWGVTNSPDEVANGLSKGLIQIKGTALPGEVGNVFVTGHSSNYPWAKGSYNNVFALLNKVVVGDMVQLKYQNVDYLYKIKEIKVVEPTDISVLESKKESVLTLMTCTPVGTSLRRLIVVANQVYPDPSNNKAMTSQDTGSNLPKIH